MRAETIKKLAGCEHDELYRACETCAHWAATLKAGNACLMGGMGISQEGDGALFRRGLRQNARGRKRSLLAGGGQRLRVHLSCKIHGGMSNIQLFPFPECSSGVVAPHAAALREEQMMKNETLGSNVMSFSFSLLAGQGGSKKKCSDGGLYGIGRVLSESDSIFHYCWCEQVERRGDGPARPNDGPRVHATKGRRFFLILNIDFRRD